MAFDLKSTQMHHFNNEESCGILPDEMETFKKGWHNTFSTLMGREVSNFATFIANTLKASINKELLTSISVDDHRNTIELYPILVTRYIVMPSNLYVRANIMVRCISIGIDIKGDRYIGHFDVEDTLEFVQVREDYPGSFNFYFDARAYKENCNRHTYSYSFQRVTVDDIDSINSTYFSKNVNGSYILPF